MRPRKQGLGKGTGPHRAGAEQDGSGTGGRPGGAGNGSGGRRVRVFMIPPEEVRILLNSSFYYFQMNSYQK